MTTKFYDLNIETLDDGTIRLEQRNYCGEPVIIDLHPVQAAFFANGQSENSISERVVTLERRLMWMRDRIEECRAVLPSDMYERCSCAGEFYAWLDASEEIANEFCAGLSNSPRQISTAEIMPHPESAQLTSNTVRSREHSEHCNAELF